MKKVVLMFLGLALGLLPASAQIDDGASFSTGSFVKEKNNAFYLGLKAGVDITSMTQPTQSKLYDKTGIGFSGGLALRGRFGKVTENSYGGTGYFGLGLELKYKQNKVKTIAGEDLTIDYFEVPVVAQVFPFAKNASMNPFYIELGASFGGALSKKPDQLTVNDNSGTVVYSIKDIKGLNVSGVAGIGYTIPSTGLDINARYYLGFTDLADNIACKMSSFEVSLAWYFKLGK